MSWAKNVAEECVGGMRTFFLDRLPPEALCLSESTLKVEAVRDRGDDGISGDEDDDDSESTGDDEADDDDDDDDDDETDDIDELLRDDDEAAIGIEGSHHDAVFE